MYPLFLFYSFFCHIYAVTGGKHFHITQSKSTKVLLYETHFVFFMFIDILAYTLNILELLKIKILEILEDSVTI